jgi:DNA-directed RNA polymerase subunit M/transcription elongation factor TFIIS
MVPKEVGTRKILVCRSCGHEKKEVRVEEYTITLTGGNKQRDVVVIEEESKMDVEERRRYLDDLYHGIGGDSDFEE